MKVFLAPGTLDEALALLGEEAPPKVLAGGTDLWPHWTATDEKPERVLSLHRLEELGRIEDGGESLRIGARVTHSALIRSALVEEACPALATAAATVGATQIQNRGTIGGNLANGSPAADLPPPLMAAGAEVELRSTRGTRRVPMARFFRGYGDIDLRGDELLVAVHVPALPSGTLERFRKVGTRRAQAISKVVGACRLAIDTAGKISHACFAFGSVAPTTIALHGLADWLVGQALNPKTREEAAQRATEAVHPIDDVRSSADYRRHVVGRMVNGWLAELSRAEPS